MVQSLAKDITNLDILTVTKEELHRKQYFYVQKKLAQGWPLDMFDAVAHWIFLPILGVGIVALTTIVALLDIPHVPGLLCTIASGLCYLTALFFVAFGVFDLAFPGPGSVRTFWLFASITFIAAIGMGYAAWIGYEQLVWAISVSGLISSLLFAVLLWIRFKYFDSKHFLGSASTGGHEQFFTPPKNITKQLMQIQEQIPDARVNLYKICSWIGTIGLPIKITKECNLYYYEIYRPKGRKNDVVYLDYFWEA